MNIDTLEYIIAYLNRRDRVNFASVNKDIRQDIGYLMCRIKWYHTDTPLLRYFKYTRPMLVYFHMIANYKLEKHRITLLLFLRSNRTKMFIGCKNSYYRRFVYKYASALGLHTKKEILRNSKPYEYCAQYKLNVNDPRHLSDWDDDLGPHYHIYKSGVLVYK